MPIGKAVMLTSGTRTTSGQSSAMALETSNTISFALTVTALSGALATLSVSILWSTDGVNFLPADPADTFATVSAAPGGSVRLVDVKGSWARIAWTLGGTTPSATFGVALYGF